MDIQLAVSRDSVHFERVADRAPLLAVGEVGAWDRFNLSLANNPPIVVGEGLRFYYGGRNYRHGPYQGNDKGERFGGIGFATIPRDRGKPKNGDSPSWKVRIVRRGAKPEIWIRDSASGSCYGTAYVGRLFQEAPAGGANRHRSIRLIGVGPGS